METLADQQHMLAEADLDLRLSRSHSRISNVDTRRASVLNVATGQQPNAAARSNEGPSDRHISDKLAAAGMQEMTKAQLVERFGKRKTAKILEGKLAVEEGKVYDMSLIKACLWAPGLQVWVAAATYALSCAYPSF
jgi:hypothetical protein